ncbi:MAG: hypothetical protein J7L21_05825 [Sulfurimonas sp.]|nr:hypothetical protein [Sulfurimonas sp.]
MKLRVLISILFIIVTTFASIHEIEHITGEHESSSCPICVIGDHLVSADISDISQLCIQIPHTIVKIQIKTLLSHAKKSDNHSHAPPIFS